VALTLSTLIVSLVASVFLAQNDFYSFVMGRSTVQDNLRVVSDLIASEIRGVSGGGVTTAQPNQFVIRLPLALGGICDPAVDSGRLYMPGFSDIDGGDVAGYAQQDAVGEWTYVVETWSNILTASGVGVAGACTNTSGTDTTGVTQDFADFSLPGGTTQLGDVVMIWQEVEFRIATSALDPTTLAVYRGVTGGALTEFATGIKAGTSFAYSKDGTTFYTLITGTALDSIQVLQVTASAIAPRSSGTGDPYEYEWTVKIPLKNSN